MSLVSIGHNHLVAGSTALCLLLLSSASAVGCGGAFLFAIMFQKYPEARVVSTAVRQAREMGALRGEEWPGIGVQSLHSWRADKVSAMVEALERRLNSIPELAADADGIHIFLINEFVWIEIGSNGKRAAVAKAPTGPGEETPKVFTTRRVLDNLLDRTITWQRAVDDGLIGSRCADVCRDEPLAVFGRVFSAQASASLGQSRS